MSTPKISDKERSEMIIKFYFIDIDKINAHPKPFHPLTLASIEDFVKKN